MKLNFDELIDKFRKPKGEDFRNRIVVFLICLAISAFVWFLIGLSKESYTSIEFPVKFINEPEDLMLANKPDSILSFRITSGGFELITLKYLTRKHPVEVDLNKWEMTKEGQYFTLQIPTKEIAQNIINKLNITSEFVSYSPQSISLKFQALKGKKIPVVSRVHLSLQKQYQLSGSVKIIPDSVTVLGPDLLIDTLEMAYTEEKDLNDIEDSMSVEVKLSVIVANENVRLVPEKVKIEIPVEKYTEETIRVPITANDYENLKVKTFPDVVNITYHVSLSDYKRVNKNAFMAVVDVGKENEQAGKLKVMITRQPDFVKITKIEPEEVEFLVLKQ